MGVLIVGASVAGIRTIQALRARGYQGEITVLGEETHYPYDKPPLTKEMLDLNANGEHVPLVSPDALDALDVDLRLGVRATELDISRKAVTSEGGDVYRYDSLVIATGVSPRQLPGSAPLENVYTVRTADDVVGLRREMVPGRKAVVIGAGFIGAEFAAAASAHGVEATLVEAQASPLALQLGAAVGEALVGLHTSRGVTVHTGVSFDGFIGVGRAIGVRLSDGRELPADFVVVGIGAQPATGWLESSGLPLSDGIECDESLRVIGVPDVYAAGDIARWRHPHYGESMRIEHWTNANDHADAVAAAIVGSPAPRPSLPYVWSDQHGKKIQIVGRPVSGSPVMVRGEAQTGDLIACYADDSGVLVGALVVDNPRLLMQLRKAILAKEQYQQFEQRVFADHAAQK
ncbi:NAD(P)/FAD-dependent oxidoreductase [Prescottella agglutinans]|uniref:NADPH-dependent 2,4-dienoyl-CoA reductase/sulfur reductase-like enzyme n=1 Tax=Prescottella agglutinans TaxID=1644129 RepID=A0ABT6MIL7_9NOCA|nr:FAD-dependent oxidoreductase [Prescottella agglutinans]MDH6284163.1 NADPH-dependent 2,4-dienoyl-CoA reductase/sulfur reductase-like enzyme [Prescottella agglutinans]